MFINISRGLSLKFQYISPYYFHFLNVGIQQCLKHIAVQKKMKEVYTHPFCSFPRDALLITDSESRLVSGDVGLNFAQVVGLTLFG